MAGRDRSVLVFSRLERNVFVALPDSSILAPALVVTTCAIVIWQYARRRTVAARLVSLTVTCAILPLTWGVSFLARTYPIQSKRPQSPDNPMFDFYDLALSTLPPPGSWLLPPSGFAMARIRLTVTGVPPKTLLRGSGRTTINVDGAAWSQSSRFAVNQLGKMGVTYWQTLDLDPSKLDMLKQHPANLHTSFDLEIVSNEVETRVPVTRHSFFVSGVGRCVAFQITPYTRFACRAGLEPSIETAVRLDSPQAREAVEPLATFPRHSIP